MLRHLYLLAAGSALILPLGAQSLPRSANVRGNGNGRQGRCTIEVWVDGAAEVEIRGSHAVLRNLTGQPPQWRRFECDGMLPPNPANFRFEGTNGRGRQTLVRSPQRGGPAVIRIEDPQNGADNYAFNIMWGGGDSVSQNRGFPRDAGPPPDRGPDRDLDTWHQQRRDWGRGNEWRAHIFERVRDDLQHVQSETFPIGRDQFRLAQALRELDEMQRDLGAGRYDERQLDDVTRTLGNVVGDNRMSSRDRDILNDDLNRLRDFRQHHEAFGAR